MFTFKTQLQSSIFVFPEISLYLGLAWTQLTLEKLFLVLESKGFLALRLEK